MTDDDDSHLDDDWFGDADPRVPDATPWPERDLRFLGDDYLGEADARPDIGSTVPSDRNEGEAELRELARRLEQHRTPAFPIDLRKRLPLESIWRRWRALAMWGRSDVVDDFGRDPRATARWEWLFEFLYSRWFRVQASGLEHVPAHGRALLVANHAGTLPYDSAMVMHAVRRDHPSRRDVRPLVEDTVFHLPFLGPIMNRIGGVRADPENAQRLLEKDELVAVFPEGEKGMGKLWRDRYRLQRFGRGGFVKLALRTHAPIIPVAVVGAEEAAPMLGKVTWFAKNIGIPWIPVTPTFPWLGPAGLLPLPSKWYVQFGEPIDLGASHGAAAAEDRLLVNRLADQIRTQIQQMIDGLLGQRRSPLLAAFLGMILDQELARLYARALIAIARADGVINVEEGLRLQQRIAQRCGTGPTVADLLLEPPIDPEALVDALRGGPFRGASVSPVELAEHLVSDGIAVVLAKGHVSASEAARLRAFAGALGVSDADFQRLTARVARWIPP